jgi:hypothetical protein
MSAAARLTREEIEREVNLVPFWWLALVHRQKIIGWQGTVGEVVCKDPESDRGTQLRSRHGGKSLAEVGHASAALSFP